MKEAFEKIRNEVRVLSEQEFCKRRKQEECDKYVDCETCLIDSVLSIVSEIEAEYANPKTNADRIRSMSYSKLADFLSNQFCHGYGKPQIEDWLKSPTTD